jgi:hypothetical protein
MERRGEQSDRGDLNRATRQVNELNTDLASLDGHIAEEKAKLDRPPKTREEARERAAAMSAYISHGMRESNAAFDPLERDGYQWWQRAAHTRSPSRRDVGAAFWEYWRERVWGSKDYEKEDLER